MVGLAVVGVLVVGLLVVVGACVDGAFVVGLLVGGVTGGLVGGQAMHVSVTRLHVNPFWQKNSLQIPPTGTVSGNLHNPSLSQVNLGSHVDPPH